MTLTIAPENPQPPNRLPIKGSRHRIVVGMSGGVDSSVVAALLKEQGHEVIGVFMKNWDEVDENGVCPAEQDFADVVKVCERLEIPYFSVNFVKEYWDHVFQNFVDEYKAGRTPNPDILCNREIKFKAFFDQAMALGADYLATGHYARIGVHPVTGEATLLKGTDPGKDQSYFLHAVTSSALEKVLFPIGSIHKSEVRRIADRYELATRAKKDSTGICFIGERDFPEFLARYVKPTPGEFRTLDGEKVGEHVGMQFYTLGQRKGLGLGGQGEPWFVVAKDVSRNIVFVERGTDHPALYSSRLLATQLTWISAQAPDFSKLVPLRAKVRYRQTDQACSIVAYREDGRLEVQFDEPQRAVTPGQSVVFYQEDCCLGGGIIDEVIGPS